MNPIMKRNEKKDSAVSPVVGVMLMLVVTIIIAAVVSAFAGGLVTSAEKAPVSVLDVKIINQVIDGMGGGSYPDFTIDHLNGDPIDTSKVKLMFTWTNTTGALYHSEWQYNASKQIEFMDYSGETDKINTTLYSNKKGLSEPGSYFGIVTISAGDHVQTRDNFLRISDWGTPDKWNSAGSPFMDDLFNNGKIIAEWDGSNGVGYKAGIMNELPVGTPVNVQIVHTPSGNLIYDKAVYVQ